jgi:hypothetical protein
MNLIRALDICGGALPRLIEQDNVHIPIVVAGNKQLLPFAGLASYEIEFHPEFDGIISAEVTHSGWQFIRDCLIGDAPPNPKYDLLTSEGQIIMPFDITFH